MDYECVLFLLQEVAPDPQAKLVEVIVSNQNGWEPLCGRVREQQSQYRVMPGSCK